MKAEILFAAGLALLAGTADAAPACAPDMVGLRGGWGEASISVELARSDAERAKGLMNRSSMPRMAGMLFLFGPPQQVTFWMHDTLIPLDMVFVGADGVIRSIHENARPMDDTPIPGGDDISAVLELNGGLAAQLGLKPGDQMRNPAFGAGAAWPCPAAD